MIKGEFFDNEGSPARKDAFYWFSFLMNFSNEIILLIDKNWEIIDINQCGQNTFGYSASEILGRKLRDFCVERMREEFDEKSKGVDQYHGTHFESCCRRKDDSEFSVEISIRAFHLEGNVYYKSVLRDITARKEAEEALHFQSQILEQVHDAVIVMDKEYSITYWNEAACRMYGFTKEEAIGRKSHELFKTSHIDSSREQIIEELKTVGHSSYKVTHLTRDGRQLNVDVRSSEFTNNLGKIVGHISSCRDISYHVQAENALRKSEERYHHLFNALMEGFCIIEMLYDASGKPVDYRFLEVNAAFESQTGLTGAKGKTIRELAPDHESHWFEIYGKIASTGEASRFMNEAKALNRWYDVYAYRVDQPEDRHVAIVFNDISELKRAEKEMRHLNRLLQALGNSRRALVQARTEKELLDEICRIIVQDCDYMLVWIGYACNDAGKNVIPMSSYGFEEGYLEKLRITWADTERGQGPTGVAIRTGQVQRCTDMLSDPKFAPWRAEAVARGYASSLVVPLSGNGSVLGALNIYSRIPAGFNDEDSNLLGELAGEIAQGILTLRLREARLKAEEALRESEERFRSVLDSSADVIYRLNIQSGLYEYISPSAVRILGYSVEELMAQDIRTSLSMIHPSDLPLVLAAFRQADETGEAEVEYRQKTASGDYRWLFNRMSLSRDESGRPLFRNGNLSDITERKKAEEEKAWLLAEETRHASEMDAVFRVLPNLVSVHGPDGRYLQANSATKNLFGFDPVNSTREEIARSLKARFPDGRPLTPLNMPSSRALKGETVFGVEYIISDRQGKEHHLLFNAVPLFVDGEVSGAVFSQMDITELKKAEKEILDLNRTLEERVNSAIEELRMKDHILIVQSRQAAMGEMINNIAHQWKQPLNILGLMIQNTSFAYEHQKLDDDYIKDFTRKGMELVQHMSQTVEDFKNYFKPDKEKIQFLVEGVIQKTIGLLENSFRYKDIELRLEIEKGIEIHGFPNEYGQVLLNLLQNAEDALMKQPEETVKFIAVKSMVRDGHCVVTIADNAGGIPQDILGRIFEPYFTTKKNGTGIGLFMSRLIIEENMGGKLDVCVSAEGSEFSICVPASPSSCKEVPIANTPHEELVSKIPASVQRSVDGHSEKKGAHVVSNHSGKPYRDKPLVLLVDDNAEMLENASERLGRDFHVLTAENGEAGLCRARELQPDIIISDVMMPVMDGYTLTTELKNDPALSSIPIILLAGKTDLEMKLEGLSVGADDYLHKPLNYTELHVRIRNLLAVRETQRELRELTQKLTYHMDYSPLAVIEWGPDMRLIRWSGEAERIFGWNAGEVLGKRIEDFRWVYDEDGAKVNEVQADLRNGTNPRRFSLNRNYRKDGAVVYCEWYNSSLLDESGNLRSILSLVMDVTQRKEAEDALHNANQQLAEADRRKNNELMLVAKVLSNSIEGILITDKDGSILQVNKAFTEITGYPEEEVMGENRRISMTGIFTRKCGIP